MGRKHEHRAVRTVRALEEAYRNARAARRLLQHLLEHADAAAADESWVELAADAEAVEYRLRRALDGLHEQLWQRDPCATRAAGRGRDENLLRDV